jgi:hypothetical protein
MFILLINDFVKTYEEWAKYSCININTLFDSIKDETGMTPQQFLCLFHCLYFNCISDCLVQSHAGFKEAFNEIQERLGFYERCSEYVVAHYDKVYKPLFNI